MKMFYVYIVECADNSYYTGFTSNLEKRINEHNSGAYDNAYTLKRRPVSLMWHERFTDPNQAIKIEKQIKGWSRRKKKALIEEKWEDLIEFSKNYRNRTSN
ncbi:GIY-YIG nuclease family protein [Salinimicrobium oceani]|uniref:GIY-YIG nuclease family protein n=1 Tax=Salinimicrobium oceani TaxID=2722702 RepID=A0ABX1CZS9_9FLAO|nr:GIY-YIG nuclease family protein [Salinimicrobium oceani]NJW53764.1 GIY-YIG nuclease family protein [Salinimicrobium oceani]